MTKIQKALLAKNALESALAIERANVQRKLNIANALHAQDRARCNAKTHDAVTIARKSWIDIRKDAKVTLKDAIELQKKSTRDALALQLETLK